MRGRLFAFCLRLFVVINCRYWAAGDTVLGVASVL
jgi:hypothetical protein